MWKQNLGKGEAYIEEERLERHLRKLLIKDLDGQESQTYFLSNGLSLVPFKPRNGMAKSVIHFQLPPFSYITSLCFLHTHQFPSLLSDSHYLVESE